VQALERLPSEPFMLFVGAFRRIKGLDELLGAYELLRDPPLLVLIGTMEPDTPKVFPPGVRVETDFTHDAVMAAWKQCLFAVLPSRWPEPFGTVVCEAMGAGKPVIGTSPGGHSDMILDGKTGFLVRRGAVEELADAMQKLIDDPELTRRMGEAAREHAAQFTADVSFPRIEALYEEVLAKQNDGRTHAVSSAEETLSPSGPRDRGHESTG
jgi:glycosyltransferase involved in cell wall biosynthesis